MSIEVPWLQWDQVRGGESGRHNANRIGRLSVHNQNLSDRVGLHNDISPLPSVRNGQVNAPVDRLDRVYPLCKARRNHNLMQTSAIKNLIPQLCAETRRTCG